MLIDTHSRKIFQSKEFLEYANCPKCKLKTERKVDIMLHKRLFMDLHFIWLKKNLNGPEILRPP